MRERVSQFLDRSGGASINYNIAPVVSCKTDDDTLVWQLKSENSQMEFSSERGERFSHSIDLEFAKDITEAIRKLVVAYSAIPTSAPSIINENLMWYLPGPSDSRRVQTETYREDRHGIRDRGTNTTAASMLGNGLIIRRGEAGVQATRLLVTVNWPNLE